MTVTTRSLILVLLPAFLAIGAFAATPGGAGDNKAITTDTVDNGGKRITVTGPNGAIVVDQSTGGILGTSNGGNFSVRHGFIAQLYEDAPALGSTLTATPNPAKTGQSVLFTVVATDEDPLTIVWNFGDGSVDTSNIAAVSHAYTTPSIYTATVTAKDSDLLQTTATIQVTVVAAATPVDPNDIDGDGIPNAVDNDADGDGFTNSIEIAAGSNPMDPTSTPLNNLAAGTPLPLTLSKLSIALNFKTANRDSMGVNGLMQVPAGFNVLGQTVIIDVGGVAQLFTLDKRGNAKPANARFALGVKAKKGVVALQTAKFAEKLIKGNFTDKLSDEKFTSTTTLKTGEARSVVVTMIFNGKIYQSTKTLMYKATAGKSGKAK